MISEGGITVNPGQDAIHHSWIDYLKSEPVGRFCNLQPVSNCIQMIGEVLTATVLVYDEMENISMDETSI